MNEVADLISLSLQALYQALERELKLRDEVDWLTAENKNLREQIGLMTRIVELEFARRRREVNTL